MPSNSNPFSTRFTRPGAIPFRFDNQEHERIIVETFAESNFIAQIVGPHGSGKTTLVRVLEPHLKTWFGKIKYVTIRKFGKRLIVESKFAVFSDNESSKPHLLVVDGIESLTGLNRWLMKTWCKRNKTGLLATVHRPGNGFPTIATLRPNSSTFLAICDWLQHPSKHKLDHETCLQAFKIANGNFREAFMTLYDQYELEAARLRRDPAVV